MADERQMTTEEKRLKRIAELKARLQKEEALLKTTARAERNGQLIAFGILVEEIFKVADETGLQKLVDSAKKHLRDRNLSRALAGFERLGKIKQEGKAEMHE